MTEEPEEGGITSTSQCGFVGNTWCQLDRIISGYETGLMAKGNSADLWGYFYLLMSQRAILPLALCAPSS